MELKDTVAMMNSADYKERFKAEYWQTKIRYEKLHRMALKYEAGTLNFEPACELSLLLEQKNCMGLYLNRLELRAEIEGIALETNDDMENKNVSTAPNGPLTLKELRELDGQPVWVDVKNSEYSAWGLVDFKRFRIWPFGTEDQWWDFSHFGDWCAYRCPPEKGDRHE